MNLKEHVETGHRELRVQRTEQEARYGQCRAISTDVGGVPVRVTRTDEDDREDTEVIAGEIARRLDLNTKDGESVAIDR